MLVCFCSEADTSVPRGRCTLPSPPHPKPSMHKSTLNNPAGVGRGGGVREWCVGVWRGWGERVVCGGGEGVG